MNELEQLMKQQVSLLQKQVEQQEEVLTQLTNYSLQLVEQNELLMQENKEKSALITTLKDELSNLKLKPLSDEQLKDFSKTSNRILQQQLQAVLTQKNIQSMSESIISNQVESQLSPYIKQLSAMISDLSASNSSSIRALWETTTFLNS